MRVRKGIGLWVSLAIVGSVARCALDESGAGSPDAATDVALVDVAIDGEEAGDASAVDADADVFIPLTAASPGELDASLAAWYRDNFLFADGGDAAIVGWQDQSGNGKDAVVPLPSLPPLYTANDGQFGGHASLTFTGTARLEAAGLKISAQPITVMLVGVAPVAATNEYFFDSLGSGNSRIAMIGRTGTTNVSLYTDQGAGDYAPLAGANANAQPATFVGVFAGQSSSLFVSTNNGLTGLNLGTSYLQGLSLGTYVANNFPLKCAIVEVAFWGEALDVTSIQRLNMYVNSRYGIAITP